jgi:hypothetical protein
VQTIGGQQVYSSRPVSCQAPTDTLELEAGYEIYRNSKLIAVFAERRSVVSSTSLPISGSIGPVSINLNYTFQSTPKGDAVTAGPFYDLDPQNENIGTPLKYTVRAKGSGCGNYNPSTPYNNSFGYTLNPSAAEITIDSNGDGRPDFYPEADFIEARTSPSDAVTLSMDQALWRGRVPSMPMTITVAGNNPSGTVTVYIRNLLLTAPVVNGVAQVPAEAYQHAANQLFCDCSQKAFAVYSGDVNNSAARSRSIDVYIANYD